MIMAVFIGFLWFYCSSVFQGFILEPFYGVTMSLFFQLPLLHGPIDVISFLCAALTFKRGWNEIFLILITFLSVSIAYRLKFSWMETVDLYNIFMIYGDAVVGALIYVLVILALKIYKARHL